MKKYLPILIIMCSVWAGLLGQDIDITITDATGLYSQDGKIKAVVDPSYGAGPYVFTWAGQAIIPPIVLDPIGDPVTTSGESEIADLNPGTYCVTITSDGGNGCHAEGCFNVGLCQSNCLNANFFYEYDMDDGCAIYFSDASSGSPSSYTWDFGDGGMAFEPAPSHIFDGPGCYDVSLTVEKNGDESTVVQEVCVYSCNNEGGMYVEIDGPSFAVANGENQSYEALVFGGAQPYTFEWDWDIASASGFGDGPYSVHFTQESAHFFSVTVTDSEGTTAENSMVVSVIDMGVDIFNSLAILNKSTSFVGKYNIGAIENFGNETFDWNFGDGTTINGTPFSLQSHTYQQTGPFQVTFTLHDGANEYSTSKTIEVYESFEDAYPASDNFCIYSLAQDAADPLYTWTVNYLGCACDESQHAYTPIMFTPNPSNKINVGISGLDTDCNDPNDPDTPCGPGFPNSACFKGHVEVYNVETGKSVILPGANPSGPDPYLIWWFGLSKTFNNIEIGEDWGCWNLKADIENVDEVKREGEWECIAYVEPTELIISEIEVVNCPDPQACDEIALRPIIEGGGFHRANIPTTNCESCSGNDMKVYDKYEWKLFSINSENLIDEGILEILGPGNCAKVNFDHPYFDNFRGATEAKFTAVITVSDFLGYTITYGQEITVPLPLTVELPQENLVGDPFYQTYEFTTCPGGQRFLFDDPPIWGGSGNELPFEAGDGTYFMGYDETTRNIWIHPDNIVLASGGTYEGSLIFNGYTNGIHYDKGCIIFRKIIINVENIEINEAAGDDKEACIGPSLQTLGFSNPPVTGGSGNYTYQWSPTIGLNDPTLPNPTVFFPRCRSAYLYPNRI